MLSVFVKPMPFSLTLHVYVSFYFSLILPIWLSLPCLSSIYAICPSYANAILSYFARSLLFVSHYPHLALTSLSLLLYLLYVSFVLFYMSRSIPSMPLSIHFQGTFYPFLGHFLSIAMALSIPFHVALYPFLSLFLSLSQSLSIPFYASFYPCLCPCISFCLCHDLSLNMSTFFLSLQFHSFCSCRFLSLFMYLFMSIMSLFHLSIRLCVPFSPFLYSFSAAINSPFSLLCLSQCLLVSSQIRLRLSLLAPLSSNCNRLFVHFRLLPKVFRGNLVNFRCGVSHP